MKTSILNFLRILSREEGTYKDKLEIDFYRNIQKYLHHQQKHNLLYKMQEMNENDLSIEFLETLNVFGLPILRSINQPIYNIELVDNQYEDGLIRYAP